MRVPVAQGAYAPARLDGDRVISAGMTPRDAGQDLVHAGVVGAPEGVPIERAAELAELAGHRAVDACLAVLPSGGRIVEATWLTVYVRSGPHLVEHSAVADGASAAVQSRIGGAYPVRAAVGVASLPGGAPVEVQLGCRWAAP